METWYAIRSHICYACMDFIVVSRKVEGASSWNKNYEGGSNIEKSLTSDHHEVCLCV